MSNDRATEVTATEPPISDAPWQEHGEPLDPNANTGPLPPLPEEPPAADQEAREHPRRWRFVPRSLSNRLVIFVTALVLVVVGATGAATYLALQSFLLNRLDQQLNGQSDEDHIVSYFQLSSPVPDLPNARGPQTVWAVALDTSGNVILDPPRLLASTMS